MLRPKRRGAYLIPAILAIIAVLLAGVAALNHYEVLGNRAYTRAEADLRFAEARKWRLFRQVQASAIPPSQGVTIDTTSVNGTQVPANISAGKALFAHDSFMVYDGLPSLLVHRDNEPANKPAPLTTDSSLKPSSESMVPFRGAKYRQVTTSVPNVCAYAPQGKVFLDKVVDWANPELDWKGNALSAFTGAPAIVAGNVVNIKDMPYGFIYASGKSTGGEKPATVKSGLAVAQSGAFPFAHFEEALADSIATAANGKSAMSRSEDCAKHLDDKTGVFNNEMPGFIDIFSDPKSYVTNLPKIFSINSALAFKTTTLLGVDEMTIGYPHSRVHITIHPPHTSEAAFAGDTATQIVIKTKKDAMDVKGKELQKLQEQIGALETRVKVFKGTEETHNVAFTSYEHRGEPGLLKLYKGSTDDLVSKLTKDKHTLQAAIDRGQTTAVTDLECTADLLTWMARYNAFCWKDRPKPEIADLNAQSMPSPGWDALNGQAQLTPEQAGQMLAFLPILHTEYDYKTERCSVHYWVNGNLGPKIEIKPGARPTEYAEVWKSWMDRCSGLKDKVQRPDKAPVTEPYLQMQMVDFLLATESSENFYRLAEKLTDAVEKILEPKSKAAEILDHDIWDLTNQIMGLFWKSLVPTSREKEKKTEDNPLIGYTFKPDRGFPGTNRIPYGFNFLFFVNLIRGIVDPIKATDMWAPTHPFVFFGTPEFPTPGTLGISSKAGMKLNGLFTVPAGRTFYYNSDMTVVGDVWLQRGSTLVCNNLTLQKEEDLSGGWELAMMKKCGRVLMEEGSTLVCRGDLKCEGGYFRGSVVMLSPMDQLHPITSAILCKGNVDLPYGIWNAQKFTDALTGDIKGKILNTVWTGLYTFVYPNTSKIPQLPKALGSLDLGPFHPRKPYFAEKCAEYDFQVNFLYIIPIPIITLIDQQSSKDNVWVKLYSFFSTVLAAEADLAAGENFMCHSDYFPHQGENGPIDGLIHKISLKSLKGQIHIPEVPPALQKLDYEAYCKPLVDNAVEYEKKLLEIKATVNETAPGQSMVQLPADAPAQVERDGKILNASKPDPVADAIKLLIEYMIKDLINTTTLIDRIYKEIGLDSDAMHDRLCREQQGVLVYGKNIDIGVGKKGIQRPKFASGLFVAEKNIRDNALYTIGAMVSKEGSINNDPECNTTLFAYPAFTQACLHLPAYDPNDTKFWLERTVDIRYGQFAPEGQQMDVAIPSFVRATAEGWDQ